MYLTYLIYIPIFSLGPKLTLQIGQIFCQAKSIHTSISQNNYDYTNRFKYNEEKKLMHWM